MIARDNDQNTDRLLRVTLASAETPDSALIGKVKRPYLYAKKNDSMKKPAFHRSFRGVAAVAVIVVLAATTVFAAWHFLRPSEVAENFGDGMLGAAFDSDTAVNINESVTSGNYIFTLLALVSGEDITDMPYCPDGEISFGRTYAVIAIQNADGSPMAAGRDIFFASPLVKGLKPWEVNAATLGGGYSEAVTDGVLYRLVECDDVTMFADRGLYFAVCTESFIDNNVFKFNGRTGEISVDPNYGGASAVFDLPIDRSLADPAKAEEYLNGLLAPAAVENASPREQNESVLEWRKAVPAASTVKELKVGDDGEMVYEYAYKDGEGMVSKFYNDCFKNDGGAQSMIVAVIDDGAYAIRFSMDENGVITGAVVTLE
jgi:hypothetical protein